MTDTLKNKFSTTLSELIDAQKVYNDRTREIVETAIKSLFQDIPELEVVQWTQYTPYFNDGDECVFSINEMSFIANREVDLEIWKDFDENSIDLDTIDRVLDGDYNSFAKPWSYGKNSTWAIEATTRYDAVVASVGKERCDEILETLVMFEKLINQCEDSVRSAYGDHSKITLWRKNGKLEILVEDYDHD